MREPAMQSEGKNPVDSCELPKSSGIGELWCSESVGQGEIKNKRADQTII